MLKVEGQLVVVVGGGPVALRKARSLATAGAKVTMVTERLPDNIDLGEVEVIHSSYSPRYLAGAKLVFACTNDVMANAQIAADAREAGAIVNCVDQPEDCDFFVPAVVSDGDVMVTIGTGGASPSLAARLKKNIANALPEQIGQFAQSLLRIRELVKAKVDDINLRGEILRKLADESHYQVFLAGGEKALVKKLDELIP